MTDDATTDPLPTPIAPADRLLTAAEFQKLADAPPKRSGSPISAIRTPVAPTRPR
jgi:hypothetical protein